MSEGSPEDMWTPYKYLQSVIEKSLVHSSKSSLPQLEAVLRKHKQNFATILRNPPKNAKSRAEIRQGITDGITLPGLGHTILSKDLVDESIILSDMYDLNEYMALELLCTAQQQMPHYPGLPRGLVAVLLYYDGRKALACSLKDLFQASSGISWCTEAHPEITQYITLYTESLVEDSGVLNKIIDLLDELDISKEIELLTANRGLGPPKHHRQVLDLFQDIKLALATALFNWSAQCGLPKDTLIKLIEHLAKAKLTESRGGIDDITVTLLMALLYGFDTSVLQRREDGEEIVQRLPIIKESSYSHSVFEIIHSPWECDELKSIVLFAFGLSMATLRQAPQSLQLNSSRIIDQDEQLVDEAIQSQVFDFMHYVLLESEIIFKTEFFFRRLHVLVTDFIDLMHSKVTELRARADETARTVQCFQQQGLDSPPNLCRNFEALMLSVGKLYGGDKLNLGLCMEYWGPMDIPSNYPKSTTRSVSLFKFIRLAGELLPPMLLIPYLKMLGGLSSCEQSARNTFNLLKQGPGISGSNTLSWDHFFGSLARYYTHLRQEQHPVSDTIYKSRVLNRSINPQEIAGLHAVLGIIKAVASHDEVARIALCEHPSWAPLHTLLGLLSCSVPISLKADLLHTLAALGKSKDTAIQLWNNIEASQIIMTIPTTSAYTVRGLESEIEQIESRNETYPLTQAILDFLFTLSTTAIPRNLGGGPRKPGLDPYLTFIIDTIFLRFYNRNYKNAAEKWEVGEKCLKLLHFYVKNYEISPADFVQNKDENSPPGFHVMLQMNNKSETLRLILHIIDEVCNNLDTYSPFPGKVKMEECALHCLSILEKCLSAQDLYFNAKSIANCGRLLSGLNKLLLDVNPRSGKPDHILNTTKFVTYNSWLPCHALLGVKILTLVARQPNVSAQLLGIFTLTERIQNEIRHGFVECLESDLPIQTNKNAEGEIGEEVELSIKEAIIDLLQENLQQPAPNIAHYLLGFDITKDIRITQLQHPGVLDFPSTCTKSLVSLLDNNLELMKLDTDQDIIHERLIDRAYGLLYVLCFNSRTSDVVLRFLRSCNDFLCRHVSSLPFKNYESAQVLNQMSSLMKCIAIELKITAANSQVSQFAHLCRILLGVVQNNTPDNMSLELSHYYSNASANITIGDTTMGKKSVDQGSRLLICHLLDCLEFEMKSISQPKWDFFDNSLTGQLLQDCEIREGNGPRLINIKKLNDILRDELNTVQSTIASGQRQLIMQEIDSVLHFALRVNSQKNKCAATVKFMEAWGQVTEVLFTVSPPFALPFETKQELLLEILQGLLSKVVPVQVMMELANLASSSVLLLLVNLRYCYLQSSNQQNSSDANLGGNPYASTALAPTSFKAVRNSPKSNTLSLKYILKSIVDWIIISGAASQKLRLNLYAALLNFMHIVKGHSKDRDMHIEDDQFVSRLDRSMTRNYNDGDSEINQTQMAIEVFTSLGDKLIDILCHDCIGGHDICKMLALSCIDMLLDMDSLTNFVNFISKRGYLSHLIDSMMKADDSLCRVLRTVPDNMRALYVYESKMAMLSRVASSHIGAELLLEQRALGVLSGMSVFDLHPDFQVNSYSRHGGMDSFVPPVDARYQQILFPALNLCDVILSTLGPENHSAISQVMHFLLSHGDMIEIVLRAGTPFLHLGLLQELSAITGLIARSSNQEFVNLMEPNTNQDLSVHLYRLQKLMLSLFPRFMLTASTLKEMFKPENITYDPTDKNKALQIKYFLEIASNIALYCRNSIANHSADHRTNGVLFSPSINDSIQRSDVKGSTLEISPSLGIVVCQLKSTVEYYSREKAVYDGLINQRSSIPSTTLDSSAHVQYTNLTERLANKSNELKHCTFITEQCLYLLWSHLDFYMLRAIPVNTLQYTSTLKAFNNETFVSSPTEAGWKITTEDVSALKKTLVLIFNETFCKSLVATTQAQAGADKGFTNALLRRVKRLIQFVPVD